MDGDNRRIALCCASNQNRSVQAHSLFIQKGAKNVSSYGTGSSCKLPGPSIDKPNVYPFGTPYKKIYDELKKQNQQLYTTNGVLNMLDRNMKIKEAPERWQESQGPFDIVISFEERVFDAILDDLNFRGSKTYSPVHVFNIQTKDNHEEAAIGALHAWNLVSSLPVTRWEEQIDTVVENLQTRIGKTILHAVLFY